MVRPTLKLLPRYGAKTIRAFGKQYYVDERGIRFPSVTTILNATQPIERKQALFAWRDRIGAEAANRITRQASHRGVSLHKHLRHYLLGEKVKFSDAVKPYWESIKPVLDEIDVVRLVEGFVYHDELCYSGRVDCVASYQGIPCVLDWKTAQKPKNSEARLRDAPLQLAAYCGAINQLYCSEGVCLDRIVVAIALPEMPAEVFCFDSQVIHNYWQHWEKRLAMFWRKAEIERPASF